MGYACVELAVVAHDAGARRATVIGRGRPYGAASVVEAGVIRLDGRTALASRLIELENDLVGVIEHLKPDTLAIEKLYAHYAHPTTAIVMGHARGVVLLAAARKGLAIVELGATEVKKSLTGNGHAPKVQMQRAVQAQLGLAETPKPPDVADAIAIGLCALRRGSRVSGSGVRVSG